MVAVFTVFFENPFWVGILESEDEGTFVVAKHVFGAEPSNAELLEFMLYRFADMPRSTFHGNAGGEKRQLRLGPVNPKRAIREAMRERVRLPSTKAQAALSSALEERKAERGIMSREARRAEVDRRFELRVEKKKRRHEGH
jgi:hypothetical protein